MATEASDPGAVASARVHDNADPAVENKEHRVGRFTRARDGFESADLDAFTAPRQFGGIMVAAENAGEPALQIAFFLLQPAVPGDDFVLAPLQCMIEIRHDQNVAG